jgi:hypothetical protein
MKTLTGNYSGTKPFSAFGVLHGLPNQREKLAGAFLSKYPKLEAELRALETDENRGVVALLLDTLLDLDLIREPVKRPQSSVPSSDTEAGGDRDLGGEWDILLSARTVPEELPNNERDSEQHA